MTKGRAVAGGSRFITLGVKLSSFPPRGLSVHILVGHAEQIPQHLGSDTAQANQDTIEIKVVVCDVVHPGICTQQFSAVIEAYANHQRAGLDRRIRGDGCQKLSLNLKCRHSIRCARLNPGQSKPNIAHRVEGDFACGHLVRIVTHVFVVP